MVWNKYYKSHQIIPNIDLKDLDFNIFLKQRKNFYHSAGLSISNFKGKTFLELAPGTGYNAFYLLQNEVKRVDLVDFNDEAIKRIKINLKKFKGKFSIYKKDIESFATKKKYDYVMIENALFNLKNPSKTLIKLFKFVKKNGFIIITTSDQYSLFSEKLRGLVAHLLLSKKNYFKKSFNAKSKLLSSFFKNHLKKLKTKTRSPSKWVEDNILHYDGFTEKNYFPIDKIIDLLNKKFKEKFIIWKTSPDFSIDYTWYKKRSKLGLANNLKKNYKKNISNFIHVKEKLDLEENKFNQLSKFVKSINHYINRISENKKIPNKDLKMIQKQLIAFSKFLNKKNYNNYISKSLSEINFFIEEYLSKKKNFKSFRYFKSFWGNGTFIISVLKDN